MKRRSRLAFALISVSSIAALAAATAGGCSAKGQTSGSGGSGGDVSSSSGHGPGSGGMGGGVNLTTSSGQGGNTLGLVVSPMNPVLTYKGAPISQQFDCLSNGQKVQANWSVDNVQIGTVDNAGLFAASGQYGGTTKVSCQVGAETASTNVTVKVAITENPGGVSPTDIGLLNKGGNADPQFRWLYPYDATVWPRGLPSPSLQFDGQAASSVWVHAESASKGIVYDGYFGNSSPTRVTLPAASWQVILGSVGQGEDLTVKVTKLVNGQASGPITETWKVAQASLKGTLYYDSYDSQLAGNIGAVLKLKPGQQAQLLQGGNGKCTVCHTVAAQGNFMLASDTSYSTGAKYDLANNGAETGQRNDYAYNFPAVYPDGSLALSTSGKHIGGMWGSATSELYDTTTGAQIPVPSFTNTVQYAAMPAFAPDGTKLAFNWEDMDERHTLAVMDFDKKTMTFSNIQVVSHDPSNLLGWPSFLPDAKALVHDVNNSAGSQSQNGEQDYGTWFCNHANLSLTDIAGKVDTPLDALNGKKNGQVYLPYGTADSDRNYEPTVLPVAVGGYYWVVFTSRRQFGNTLNDPESCQYGADAHRKKLWIAAIDLNYKAGMDPSHPAIYLDGQEEGSGNMRGFWVLDPCKQNGNDCDSGDECCNGFCRQINADGGMQKVCVPPPMGCAMEFEMCNTAADCCGVNQGYECINHHCAQPPPPK